MSFKREETKEKLYEAVKKYNIESEVIRDPEWIHLVEKPLYDEENNALFFFTGGRGEYTIEIPAYYKLIWKENMISIIYHESGEDLEKLNKIYVHLWIDTPESLRQFSDEIFELIKEGVAIFKRYHLSTYIREFS